jgi:uncharacterized protein with HEPN domain
MRRARNQRFDFFLVEMQAAMKRIAEYTKGKTYSQFTDNTQIRDAVIRNFEVMGESVKHVPFSFQNAHTSIPWYHILSLRNFIVHEFFDIDEEILWEIIQNDLEKNIHDMDAIIHSAQQPMAPRRNASK